MKSPWLLCIGLRRAGNKSGIGDAGILEYMHPKAVFVSLHTNGA